MLGVICKFLLSKKEYFYLITLAPKSVLRMYNVCYNKSQLQFYR